MARVADMAAGVERAREHYRANEKVRSGIATKIREEEIERPTRYIKEAARSSQGRGATR
jgi:hypothetical protein